MNDIIMKQKFKDTEIIIAVAIIANKLIFKIIIWDINDVEHCNN